MPAKVGPKRDRALTRAGCYFDGTAATRGAELFDLRRERRLCSCNHDRCVRVCECSVRRGLSFKASISLGILGSVVAALSTSLRAKRSNPFFLYAAAWIAFARGLVRFLVICPSCQLVAGRCMKLRLRARQISSQPVGWAKRSVSTIFRRTCLGTRRFAYPATAAFASPALAHVNVDIEIDIAHAGLRRLMRAAFMPAAGARACIADIVQLQASPLRQRP